MEKVQDESRWFLIEHKCGAVFNVNVDNIIDSFDPSYNFRCPGCFELISKHLKEELLVFCKAYKKITDVFEKEDFHIEEIRAVEGI